MPGMQMLPVATFTTGRDDPYYKDIKDARSAAEAVAQRMLELWMERDGGEPLLLSFGEDAVHVLFAHALFRDEETKGAVVPLLRSVVKKDPTTEGVVVASECWTKTVRNKEDAPRSLAEDPEATEGLLVSAEWRDGPNCAMLYPVIKRQHGETSVVEFGEPHVMEGNDFESRFHGVFE